MIKLTEQHLYKDLFIVFRWGWYAKVSNISKIEEGEWTVQIVHSGAITKQIDSAEIVVIQFPRTVESLHRVEWKVKVNATEDFKDLY